MSVIEISVNAIMPLGLFIALGYLLGRIHVIGDNTAKEINIAVYKVFIPANIVYLIYNADLNASGNIKTVIFVMAVITATFGGSWFITDCLEKDRRSKPVIIQGILKSNYNLLGSQVLMSIYGTSAGLAGVLMPFVTIANNVYSAYIFEHYRGHEVSKKQIAFDILKNPLVFWSAVGVVLNLTNIPIPDVLYKNFIGKLSTMATPLSLIALGATLKFDHIKKYRKQLLAVCVSRLIILPLVFIPLAALVGIRGIGLCAVAIVTGTPTAINSYSTAVSMDGNDELAGAIVVLTTLGSLITLFVIFCIIGNVYGF